MTKSLLGSCRDPRCRKSVLWAESAVSDKKLPLEVPIVDATAPGAMALIDGRAYSHKALTERLVTMGDPAASPADFEWHIPHWATCPGANDRRRS